MADASSAVLSKPLTAEEVLARRDTDGYVTGVVRMDLGGIVDGDTESFLDALGEALIGSELLMDISY